MTDSSEQGGYVIEGQRLRDPCAVGGGGHGLPGCTAGVFGLRDYKASV